MSLFNLIIGATVNNGTLWTDIFFAVCTVIIFGRFELRARTLALRVVEGASLFALASLLDVVLNIFGLSSYPAPTYVSLFVVLAVYALAQERLDPVDRLVRATTFGALFVITVGFTRVVVPSIEALSTSEFGYNLTSWISYVVMFASAAFVRGLNISGFAYVPRNFVFLVAVTDVIGAAASQVFISLRNSYSSFFESFAELDEATDALVQSVSTVNLVVDVLFLALVIVAYIMFYSLAEEHDQRAELLVTKKSDADGLQISQSVRAMYDELREVRHELKNHDAYLLALLDEGDYARLGEVLRRQVEERERVLSNVASGNTTLDAVINVKATTARSEGIDFKAMLAVPEELPYDEEDLFRLFANLLDNAIEGTLAAGRGGAITLKVMPQGNYWFVSVANPCDTRRIRFRGDGTLRTSKADADVHGYGTRVISQIAEKYDGMAAFSVKDGVFYASVMLSSDGLREAA